MLIDTINYICIIQTSCFSLKCTKEICTNNIHMMMSEFLYIKLKHFNNDSNSSSLSTITTTIISSKYVLFLYHFLFIIFLLFDFLKNEFKILNLTFFYFFQFFSCFNNKKIWLRLHRLLSSFPKIK
jgi:hypothetical protein